MIGGGGREGGREGGDNNDDVLEWLDAIFCRRDGLHYLCCVLSSMKKTPCWSVPKFREYCASQCCASKTGLLL